VGYELLQKGTVVSFLNYAPEILGQDFTSVTINGRFDRSVATALGLDVLSKFANIYPIIKDNGVANDPDSADYLKITKPSGATAILWVPWIIESSIATVGNQVITAVIDAATPSDVAIVVAALESNGYGRAVVTIA